MTLLWSKLTKLPIPSIWISALPNSSYQARGRKTRYAAKKSPVSKSKWAFFARRSRRSRSSPNYMISSNLKDVY